MASYHLDLVSAPWSAHPEIRSAAPSPKIVYVVPGQPRSDFD